MKNNNRNKFINFYKRMIAICLIAIMVLSESRSVYGGQATTDINDMPVAETDVVDLGTDAGEESVLPSAWPYEYEQTDKLNEWFDTRLTPLTLPAAGELSWERHKIM